MTESELLMLQMEVINLMWGIIQTWVGVTTAMVAAAHFAAARLNAFLVTGMVSLYSLFTLLTGFQGGQLQRRIMAIARDLVALQDSGVVLSQSSLFLVENISLGLVRSTAPFVLTAVALASLIYVIYCYRKRGT